MRKLLIYTFLVLSISSCVVSRSRKCSSKDNAMPAEIFANKSEVLLFARGESSKINKEVTQTFTKRFLGKFETIDSLDLNKTKYSDIEKYRFVFRMKILRMQSPSEVYLSPSNPSSSQTVYRENDLVIFEILDRKTNLIYKPDCWAGGYKVDLNGYIDNLNLKFGVK